MDLVIRLGDLGYPWTPAQLENPTYPILAAKRTGDLLFVSGQIPLEDGQVIVGPVGTAEFTVEGSRHAGELCAVAALYAAGAAVDPEDILGVADLLILVNCATGFTDTSGVANGVSKFFIEIFGESGKHPRTAVGAVLPRSAALEIKVVFEVRPY